MPSGELAFDGYSRLGLRLIRNQRSVRTTGAKLHWAINDPRELEKQVPRLKLMTDLMAYDRTSYDPRQIARMSWPARLAVRALAAVPGLGKIGRLLHYRF